MKKISLVLGIVALGISASTCKADGIGLTVSGALTLFTSGSTPLQPSGVNYADSQNFGVPAGYGNSNTRGTAVIGSGTEFGITNGSDLLSVDFTGTLVTIKDTCVGGGCGTTAFTLEMYSPYITSYSLISNSFTNLVMGFGNTFYYPGPGGSITFFGAPNFTGATMVFSYTSITPPASQALALRSFALASTAETANVSALATVPEPATFGMMATGLIGIAGLVRRRFKE